MMYDKDVDDDEQTRLLCALAAQRRVLHGSRPCPTDRATPSVAITRIYAGACGAAYKFDLSIYTCDMLDNTSVYMRMSFRDCY